MTKKNQERVVLKSRIYLMQIQLIIALLCLIVFFYMLKENTTLSIVSLAIFGIICFIIKTDLNDYELNSEGVLICKNQRFYSWENIKYVYLDYHVGRTTNKYLTVVTTEETKLYNFDYVPITFEEFAELVQKLSGRNIGARYNPAVDEMTKKMAEEQKLSEAEIDEKRQRALTYLPMFDKLSIHQHIRLPYKVILGTIEIFLLIIAFFAIFPKGADNNLLVICLLLMMDMFYASAFIYAQIFEFIFKRKTDIMSLSEEEYAEYKQLTRNRNEVNSLSDKIIIYSVYILAITGLILFSYFFYNCHGEYFQLFESLIN